MSILRHFSDNLWCYENVQIEKVHSVRQPASVWSPLPHDGNAENALTWKSHLTCMLHCGSTLASNEQGALPSPELTQPIESTFTDVLQIIW